MNYTWSILDSLGEYLANLYCECACLCCIFLFSVPASSLLTFSQPRLGMCLLRGRAVTPYRLSFPLLQHILGAPLSFSDLAFVDSELYNNLKFLREHEEVERLGLDFTVTVECFGAKNIVELKPGGRNLSVNSKNVDEYIKLRFQHLVLGNVDNQVWHLRKGFYEVIPPELICIFDFCELELLLNGLDELDVNEWRRWTTYYGDFKREGAEHPVVCWFWETVEDMSPEEKTNLLQFCTGSSRLPPLGFKTLTSNDGCFCRFSIHSIPRSVSLLPSEFGIS